jgi:hypothetical protein
MIAIVSSIAVLLYEGIASAMRGTTHTSATRARPEGCNMNATRMRIALRQSWAPPTALCVALVVASGAALRADGGDQAEEPDAAESRVRSAALVAVGFASGLLAHEGGHLFFDVAFDADPGIARVEFGGVPFFAITHRSDLSPRREYAVSAAGFWTQHALSEWVLHAHPDLRRERRPILKGLLAWHVISSGIYTVAALGQIGPLERDTRGMALSLGLSERWVGVLIAVPAVCDAWRYVNPDARWPRWVSRVVKAGLVLAVIRARG